MPDQELERRRRLSAGRWLDAPAMILFRSILFAIAFYVNCILWFILAIVTFVLPTDWYFKVVKGWANSCLWLHRLTTGSTLEIRGLRNIPAGGFIVASKHQSVWETLALVGFFERPTFILKRELMWVPLFGWHLWRAGQIPIDRARGGEVMAKLTGRVRQAIAEGRQVLIFPEGTRRAVGAPPAYKYGCAKLYAETGSICLPIAHNAGVAWPRRRFLKFPVPIAIEFLEPIPPGLPMEQFHATMQERIETATNRLVAEAQAHMDHNRSAIQASVES
jgi:1-acyl-sn-glycerol-3-phosphate acyltransferase